MGFSTLNSQTFCNTLIKFHSISPIISPYFYLYSTYLFTNNSLKAKKLKKIKCSTENQSKSKLRTCKNCKTQFDPSLNHPLACRFHTSHFGGETKRKFESVYSGGTMDTPNSGQVFQYWHCCGSEDPFDPGCTSAPHTSYDD